ncbi:MAG TPA: EamA family transporter [bacterium]|nr:EamA family transporter [bacterium]
MLYLMLAVISSSSIALILKFSESRDLNRLVVTTSNYVVASVVSLFFVLEGGLFNRSAIDVPTFFLEMNVILNGGIFSENSSFIWAIATGIFGGILYFLGFIYIQKSIRDNGVGITGAFSKIGIFIPMIMSIILWKEYPSNIQWIGIVLAVSAIILANYTPEVKNSLFNFRKSLILVFLIAGLAEFSNKFFQNYSIPEYKSLFLLVVFSTALIISSVATFIERKPFTKKDLLTGFLVGIPNMLTSFFLISSFKYVKATVAFPAYSAGTIVVINLGGYLIFKEKLMKKDMFATAIIVSAIVLMSL